MKDKFSLFHSSHYSPTHYSTCIHLHCYLSLRSLLRFPPESHHWRPRPAGSPVSHCLSSPSHIAGRSLSSHTCTSGTACCSFASQMENMLPRQEKESHYVGGKEDGASEQKSVVRWRFLHLDSTGAAVQGRGRPGHPPITVSLHMDMQGHIKHPIVTAKGFTPRIKTNVAVAWSGNISSSLFA